jgi:N6-adenosine-specific RNA methylase IME4
MPRPPLHKSGPMTATERQQRWRERIRKREAAEVKLAPLRAKQHRREERERALAVATLQASQRLGSKLYGMIYMDPPWQFTVYSRATGLDRSADNHYPTMPIEQLAALPLPAARDCVLYLWTTVSQLDNALNLIRGWEFTYRSAHGWAKPRLGTGYWVRDNLELLLIATRGHPIAPAPGQQLPALMEAEQGPHSAKPEIFAAMIERMYPSTPKLEMFAGLGDLGQRGEGGRHSIPNAGDRLLSMFRASGGLYPAPVDRSRAMLS